MKTYLKIFPAEYTETVHACLTAQAGNAPSLVPDWHPDGRTAGRNYTLARHLTGIDTNDHRSRALLVEINDPVRWGQVIIIRSFKTGSS
jgi:hypothetical protein